jgi:predicted O-methyltransferase YrrM
MPPNPEAKSLEDLLRNAGRSMGARHAEVSVIASQDDNPGKPSRRLLEVSLQTIRTAMDIQMHIFDGRPRLETDWYNVWPGEHYKLLAALVKTLGARVVVEIGTYLGAGSLSLAQEIGPGKVHTFDVIGWDAMPSTWFKASDFDSTIVQHLADLSHPDTMDKYAPLLAEADLIFVDAPKDNIFEPAFIQNFETIGTKKDLIVVFDDVRVINMLGTWRHINRPKLDLVSFGHWSGTGIVDWNG